jgi:hypothetical protein
MRSILLATNLILLASMPFFGEQVPKTATSPRICVANFKTELKQASDTLALRDRLAGYMKTGTLASEFKAGIFSLQADSDQAAASEIATERCDFVIYTRGVVGKLPPETVVNNGVFPAIGPTKKKSADGTTLVPGVQFTVVRVSSGMPVLIDRVFLDREYKKEEDLWLLLRAEQEKIDKGLGQRLSPEANKPKAD